MQKRISTEKRNLEEDNNKLKRSELKFEENLKASERKTIEAIISSEDLTRKRMEKAEELRLLKAKILHLQAEISRNDVKLYEYRGYQRFLESLVKMKETESSQIKQDDLKQLKSNNADVAEERQADVLGIVLKAVIKFQRRLQVKPQTKGQPKKTTSQDHQLPADEQFNLFKYFKDPSELIDLLKDLEVSNLALIQNCQDAEEIIESLRKTEKTLKEESEAEVESLTEKIKHLKEIVLNGDDEFIEEFNQKLVPEEVANEEKEFEKLCENIALVYQEFSIRKEIKEEVLLENQNNAAVKQFAQIEAHFAELLSSVSSYPPERVAALFSSVRNARRKEFRRQKREDEQRKQEERNRRILERAQAPPPDVTAFRRAAAKSQNRNKI